MRKSLVSVAHRNPMPIEGRTFTRNDDGTITVSIPINFKRHGGRKYIVAPTEQPTPPSASESNILKALGRAFHWQALMENDPSVSHDVIAKKEALSSPYVSKVMKLTLLAPDVIEAILDGRCPSYITLVELIQIGYVWEDQRKLIGIA